MAGITTYLSILTLNVISLANCIKKEDPPICCLQETHLIDKNKHWLKVKGWEKIFKANGPPKQAGVANRQSRLQTYIDQMR
jgi:exonuclease III